jgi:hypothetical protein
MKATNPMLSPEAIRERVIEALEKKDFDWRTVKGIAEEVGVQEAEVLTALNELSETIVRTTSYEGQLLFATRKRYQETHGLGARLLSALSDKVVA